MRRHWYTMYREIVLNTDSLTRIAITGHRLLTDAHAKVIKQVMHNIVSEKVSHIYFGGAVGADSLALTCAYDEITGKGCLTRLIVVVPDTVDKQQQEAQQYYGLAHEVIELKNPITALDGYLSYRKRNTYMVDNSDRLIAFYNGDKRTGTYQTIRYADRVGKPVVIRK